MPQMNRLDFIQQIREGYNSSRNKNCQIKVVLISAFMISEFTLNEKIPNLKIDKILEKPIPLDLFKQTIESLIRK